MRNVAATFWTVAAIGTVGARPIIVHRSRPTESRSPSVAANTQGIACEYGQDRGEPRAMNTATAATIGDIFVIPDTVHQGDFVLRLTEGLTSDRRKQTLRDYVVTPQLVTCFDQALSLIGAAVTTRSSKGAYLHGSFGSGKSHFMAVLDMILEGDSDARAIQELASVVTKHNRWWQGGKFLVVPFHMIGAESMESAILGGYAAYVRQHHPDAPTPGFYRSTELVADANRLRDQMGDERFFAALVNSGGSGTGWGTMGSGWDALSYDVASRAAPEDSEHQRLVSDLVDAFFSHLRTDASTSNYVSLDRGLGILSRHAQRLGYTAVVLFLDELILWLASHSQDQAFLTREGQKISKLVEASDADRPIPIVSFIARQRDLRELIGASVPGAQQLAFADVLQWWEARFDKIALEDRNLPAIIERRLLRVKGSEQKQILREAFERTARVRQDVLDILLTHEGDKQMFEQVYPFSPALVQALVALSGLLQRERTALKLMLQLLVKNKDRLLVGDVIPVGDLFDVIIEGDEPFTPVIKHLFDRAREVWTRKFVPLLEAEHNIADQDVRDGNADAGAIRRYRADAGLLKTLLLSSLAPEVESLRNLTPARLAALNHGTIRSPLPNGEASTILAKVRGWASHAGEIQISTDAGNPLISMQLSGVDIEGVLENARNIDNFGNRVRTVKELLFGDIGIDTAAATVLAPEYNWLWRGTSRRAEILLHNVRQCSDDNFRPSDGVWRVVVDYPFDEDDSRNPLDDGARVDEFRELGESVRTLVWIPSFLNERALSDLARLGILNPVLSGNRLEEYGAHLQPAERSEARATLKNQRDQLDQRVRASLKQAYGIAQGADNMIHTTHALDEHFRPLFRGLNLQPPPGGSFKDSIENLLDQALGNQYPGHPKFEGEIRRPGLRRAWEVLEKAIDSADGRYGMERSQRDEIRRIVQPLNLAQCGEAHLAIGDHWRNHFMQKMSASGVVSPTVRQLRQWIDDPRAMGLPDDISDLIIATWAAQTGRSAYLHGTAVPIEIGGLNRECELREQTLPPEESWTRCVRYAAEIFGEAGSGAGRNAANVAALAQALGIKANEHIANLRDYQQGLNRRLDAWRIEHDNSRANTAEASLDLVLALTQANASDRIAALSNAHIATTAAAMGTIVPRAQVLAQSLRSAEWEVLNLIRSRTQTDTKAKAIIDAMTAALNDDEHVTRLDQQLAAQHRAALQLLNQPVEPSPPAVSPVAPPVLPPPKPAAMPGERQFQRKSVGIRSIRESLLEVEQALATDPELRADIECRVYRPDTTGESST
jgi:hypothetical protein